MKKILTMLLLMATFQVIAEEKDYGDVIVSAVNAVHDGDTITVTINKWPAVIGDKVSVRVANIDTPEINGSCLAEKELAQKAKQFTLNFITTDKRIYLRKMKRDKYFRILADVSVSGKYLSQELIAAGLAKPYDGGKKESWCPTAESTPGSVLANN